jgi:hypothetical protein
MRIEDGEKVEARRRPGAGPDAVRGLPGRAHPGGLRPVLGLGGGAVQALLRLRGDPGHLRRQSRISPASLLSSFERITDAVTGGKITDGDAAHSRRISGCSTRKLFVRRQPVSPIAGLSELRRRRTGCGRTGSRPCLTSAGFRVLPRSTMLTAPMARSRQHPGRARAPDGAPRAVTVLSSAYHSLARGQVGLEGPVLPWTADRYAPAARAGPDQRRQHH